MSEKILQLNEENYQGANQGIGPRQRGGNAERAVGTRGGVTDAGRPLRAQRSTEARLILCSSASRWAVFLCSVAKSSF